MTLTLRHALYWIGRGLGLAGVAFVGLRLVQYGKQVPLGALGAASWSALAALAISYALASLMLALAWRAVLAQCGVTVTCRWAIATYGVSQLARYVPGNIMHLASRHAIGMAAGLAARPLLAATGYELGLLVLAGASYGWLALPLVLHGVPPWAAGTLFLASTLLVGRALVAWPGRPVARAFAWQVSFLGISAALFVTLILSTGAAAAPGVAGHAALLGGAYVVAWLGGLLTPGAPAGLGVREFILLSLLTPLLPEAALLMAILLGRCVTVAGDCLVYGLTQLTARRAHVA